MQKSGGLWPLTQDTETKIVTYLAQNYGPDEAFRRAPISGYLMPVNPYGSEAKREFEDKKKSEALPPPLRRPSEERPGRSRNPASLNQQFLPPLSAAHQLLRKPEETPHPS